MPESQAGFSRALLDPALPLPAGLAGPAGRPAGRRFDIYRNNVVTSLVDALGEGFPATRRVVGEVFFRAMAAAFVRAHPPFSPCIIVYGDRFASFIDGFEPAARLPWLGDVARLEFARTTSFHAADDASADPLVLQGLGEETLETVRMTLRASCAVVRSAYPVWSIWRYNATGDRSAVGPGAEDALVSRPAGEVLVRRLPPGGADLLDSLGRGEALGRALRSAAAGDSRFDAGAALGVILEAGVVRTIVTRQQGEG